MEKVAEVDHTFLEGLGDDGQTLLTDLKFQATIRGWGDKAQQYLSVSLLSMQEARMVAVLQKEKHIFNGWSPGDGDRRIHTP